MVQNAVFDAKADENTIISQATVPTFTANVWKSNWVSTKKLRRLTGILASDAAMAAAGVVIEQSVSSAPTGDSDAHYHTEMNADLATNPITGQAYYRAAWSIERVGLFARLVIKHNGVEPTSLIAKVIGAGIT